MIYVFLYSSVLAFIACPLYTHLAIPTRSSLVYVMTTSPVFPSDFLLHVRRWVPWSTALGSHELYIAQRIYGLTHLSDEEHYLLHFCFRGSSYVNKDVYFTFLLNDSQYSSSSTKWNVALINLWSCCMTIKIFRLSHK